MQRTAALGELLRRRGDRRAADALQNVHLAWWLTNDLIDQAEPQIAQTLATAVPGLEAVPLDIGKMVPARARRSRRAKWSALAALRADAVGTRRREASSAAARAERGRSRLPPVERSVAGAVGADAALGALRSPGAKHRVTRPVLLARADAAAKFYAREAATIAKRGGDASAARRASGAFVIARPHLVELVAARGERVTHAELTDRLLRRSQELRRVGMETEAGALIEAAASALLLLTPAGLIAAIE
jgi:hypothetical protein